MLPSSMGTILILAGERGAGKTSACREAARLAAAAGLSVGGLLCPSWRDGSGLPVEIEAEAVATGERRPLASRERDLGGPRWPPEGGRGFSFSEECFAWALGLLREGLRGGTDFLVLDEVGPVELVLRAGFRPFLDGLGGEPTEEARRGLLLATVRPALADELARLPAFGAARRLALDLSTRAALPVEIARAAARSARKKARMRDKSAR